MSTPTPTAGFVLAGGRSLRMGCDKALLDWHGVTLLDHMRQLLVTICEPVFIIGREELPDRMPGLGPVGGIATALHHTRAHDNLIVAVDLPFLTIDFLKYFKESCVRSSKPLTVCKMETGFPLCLGIRMEMRQAIDDYLLSGKRSLQGLIEESPHETLRNLDPQLFMNINTMDDYRLATDDSSF